MVVFFALSRSGPGLEGAFGVIFGFQVDLADFHFHGPRPSPCGSFFQPATPLYIPKIPKYFQSADVTQSVECSALNRLATGSSPVIGSFFFLFFLHEGGSG